MRRVHTPLLLWKSNIWSVSAALGTQCAQRMRHIVICGLPDSTVFSALSHKRQKFVETVTQLKMFGLISFTTFI
jgi:hypothetical protein